MNCNGPCGGKGADGGQYQPDGYPSQYQPYGSGSPQGGSARNCGPPQGQNTRGYGYGQTSPHTSGGTSFNPYGPGGGPGPHAGNRRAPCGPQPCGREMCPKVSKNDNARQLGRSLTVPSEQGEGGPKGFEMNDAAWSLCGAVVLFCCGVYLTKKMGNVASELG